MFPKWSGYKVTREAVMTAWEISMIFRGLALHGCCPIVKVHSFVWNSILLNRPSSDQDTQFCRISNGNDLQSESSKGAPTLLEQQSNAHRKVEDKESEGWVCQVRQNGSRTPWCHGTSLRLLGLYDTQTPSISVRSGLTKAQVSLPERLSKQVSLKTNVMRRYVQTVMCVHPPLSRSPNGSAGEHLDVRLLLILPSPSFFTTHPALSPLCTPLFIPPFCDRSNGWREVSASRGEREGERGKETKGARETTLYVRFTRHITFTWLHTFTCYPSLFALLRQHYHAFMSCFLSASSESGRSALSFSISLFHLSLDSFIHLLFLQPSVEALSPLCPSI